MPRGVGVGNKKKKYNMFEIKIGKLSKTKIKEILFKELEDNGFHVTNVEVGNGYFLFDLGQNSVVHFNIKEIPYWKFGFWIQKDDEKKEYTIEFFGEKIDWIDKFKPSRCTISAVTRVRWPPPFSVRRRFSAIPQKNSPHPIPARCRTS
jgi:hypothetical protein